MSNEERGGRVRCHSLPSRHTAERVRGLESGGRRVRAGGIVAALQGTRDQRWEWRRGRRGLLRISCLRGCLSPRWFEEEGEEGDSPARHQGQDPQDPVGQWPVVTSRLAQAPEHRVREDDPEEKR